MLEPVALRFGEFCVDLGSGELRAGPRAVKLQRQPQRVLRALLLRRGELVSRDELKRLVWGNGTSADLDQRLNFCIKQVRAALCDRASAPRFVETLPRRGYRFIAPVEPVLETKPLLAPATRAAWRRLFAPLAAALVSASLLGPSHVSSAPDTPPRMLVAVLPFENQLGDGAEKSLSDGLTEETINGLGQLFPERLGVIARSAAMAYKNAAKPLRQVGRELGVSHVVEGSVCRAGKRVRVVAKLVRVDDQSQLWADSYELAGDDILQLQNQVAARIASSLREQLVPALAAPARPTPPAETVGA